MINSNENTRNNSWPTGSTDSRFNFGQVTSALTFGETFEGLRFDNNPQVEFMRYLEDPRSEIESLRDYPTIKKLYLKANTVLPSSAHVERLFSYATMLAIPKFNLLTPKNFGVKILSADNNKMFE